MKKQWDRLKRGDQVAIEIKAYQEIFNKFNSPPLSKYENIRVTEDFTKRKFSRPIVIIFNSPYSNYLLSVSESTSNSFHNKHYEYKTNLNTFLKSEILFIEKNKIKFIKNKIYKAYPEKEISEFELHFSNQKQQDKKFLYLKFRQLKNEQIAKHNNYLKNKENINEK